MRQRLGAGQGGLCRRRCPQGRFPVHRRPPKAPGKYGEQDRGTTELSPSLQNAPPLAPSLLSSSVLSPSLCSLLVVVQATLSQFPPALPSAPRFDCRLSRFYHSPFPPAISNSPTFVLTLSLFSPLMSPNPASYQAAAHSIPQARPAAGASSKAPPLAEFAYVVYLGPFPPILSNGSHIKHLSISSTSFNCL